MSKAAFSLIPHGGSFRKRGGLSHSHHAECGVPFGFRPGQHHALQLGVYCHAESGGVRPAKLAKLLNISNEQMSYVTNADAGCGLIRYGSALVPFINRFPRDTKLYALMTTKPGEGVFGGEGGAGMSNIRFASPEHRDFFLDMMSEARRNGLLPPGLFLCDGDCPGNAGQHPQMFDFKQDCIEPDGMHGGWQTSGTVRGVPPCFQSLERLHRPGAQQRLFPGGFVLLRVLHLTLWRA